MVLAILAEKKLPKLKVTLVESIKKKTLYLNHVKEISDISNVEILKSRVESLNGRVFDVITARAVKALDNLLAYVYPLLSKSGVCIFPKGQSYQDEISAAKKHWSFEYKIVPSKTSNDGKILIISNLVKEGRK